jgi:hypothetical protein
MILPRAGFEGEARLSSTLVEAGPADPVEGQRLAIETKLSLTSSGAFELAVENSTKPIAMTKTHAGIVPVKLLLRHLIFGPKPGPSRAYTTLYRDV